MPDISIIIPSYNYAGFIRESVDSVLAQMEAGDELIVVDDGSTDDTKSRLNSYIEDNSLSYVFQKNSGVSAARNKGAALATNDYLYFVDADDHVLVGGMARLRQHAASHPGCAMVIAAHETLEDNGRRRVHHQKDLTDSQYMNFIDYVIRRRFSIANGGVVLVKRDIALKYPYPESIRVSEDFCVFAWILASHDCCSVDVPVVSVRKHESSLRNQLTYYEDAVARLPGILFDADKIPAPLLKYKRIFKCNRLLSLFRAEYLAGDLEKARNTYVDALKCRPANIFKLSYFRKYLRALVRR